MAPSVKRPAKATPSSVVVNVGGDKSSSSPKAASGGGVLGWLKANPGKVLLAVGIVLLVALVIYWVSDNLPLIRALGTAAVIAATFPILAVVIAGIVTVAAPAMIAGVKWLKNKLASNKDDIDSGKLTPKEAAADDAASVETAKGIEADTNSLDQANASGSSTASVKLGTQSGDVVEVTDADDVPEVIESQESAGDPVVSSEFVDIE